MTCLRLILGDQLNARHAWFREVDDAIVYVLMEVRSETDYVRHHAQKVLGIFAAMRRFGAALAKAGHRVEYLRIGDDRNRHSFADNLPWLIEQFGATRLERMEADEWRVEQALCDAFDASGLPNAVVSAEHFLLERDEAAKRFEKKVPRMEFFYRDLRRRHQILLEPDGEPRGGRWNFDAENRAKWPGDPPAPSWPWQKHDLRELWSEIEAAGVQTMGEPCAEAFGWPLTRREAQAWLKDFITHRLVHFGQFQDAISGQSRTLFHAGLSFALNLKMLHPREVIEAAIAAFEDGQAELAATEGFVRQILGWREYVRGIYWARMPGYAELNALDAKRPLPAWYWTADTKMACLRAAIGQSLALGYAHHIQRLMLTGNFALLAGCVPDEVDAWYLGIYVDAFEWVEMPNTRGMSQFADGGIVGSKPYSGSAAYVNRQSDHCKGCHYTHTKRHGERACPFNSLYWHFHARHQATFGRNPRLGMTYRSWEKMAPDERAATLAQAERYLAQVDEL
ncbi:cryptochrome/photolyase family protein [Dyella sp.]|jgi:deoxyribodipyrimidine photolyase-related protein|uniref:cryptochrome/photolyase family protein n=1 Tax=Dyella sp. TaxID=1869338 RepID=UPI002D776F44|nr:cryptochrome/photolyase family protein [Dyella sp.]HET6433747.1 cryptochrome/photolyase family protein [Dyella sp.]